MLSTWNELTQYANKLCEQKRCSQALLTYQQALLEARCLFEIGLDECRVLAAFVISHQNLADCYDSIHQHKGAQKILKKGYEELMAMHSLDELESHQLSAMMRLQCHLQFHVKRYGQLTPEPVNVCKKTFSELHFLSDHAGFSAYH